jgi:predicted metal-dependent hydrolase
MAQKVVWLPEIGEVTLAKRKGSRSLRLSVSAAGRVRVGLPTWVPYATGIEFAKKRSGWITAQLEQNQPHVLSDRSRVGKSYRVMYVYSPLAKRTSTRLSAAEIKVVSHLPLVAPAVQSAVKKTAERALRKEAEKLLPPRLDELAKKHGFTYKSVRIKKLTSRWGSCSSERVITLNYFLMQLPWRLIDYVLIHELVHTKHLNHSSGFWSEFDRTMPGAKKIRAELKAHRPVINAVV